MKRKILIEFEDGEFEREGLKKLCRQRKHSMNRQIIMLIQDWMFKVTKDRENYSEKDLRQELFSLIRRWESDMNQTLKTSPIKGIESAKELPSLRNSVLLLEELKSILANTKEAS